MLIKGEEMHYLIMGNQLGYLLVKGYDIEYEGCKMFVHKRTIKVTKKGGPSLKGKYYKQINKYEVSCVKTGLAAFGGFFNQRKKAVIEDFYIHMKNVFPSKNYKNFKEARIDAIKEYGLTPEFDKSKESLILKDRLL